MLLQLRHYVCKCNVIISYHDESQYPLFIVNWQFYQEHHRLNVTAEQTIPALVVTSS